MSPERNVSRESRVARITRKLIDRQNNERPSRSNTLNYQRVYHSTGDLWRGRNAHVRRDQKRREERTAKDRTTDELTKRTSERDLGRRSVSSRAMRWVSRSLLVCWWKLLVVVWWLLTLLPRSLVSVFVKEKRRHKEDAGSEKSSKKYKVSEENKVSFVYRN